MENAVQKVIIIGVARERAALLSAALSRSGAKVWVATGEPTDVHSLQIDSDVFQHRLFHNRTASLYELFEAVDTHPGALDLVIFEVGPAFDRVSKRQTLSDPNTAAIITTIAQSIRRMEPQGRGLIYICDAQQGQKNSPLITLFTKAQSIRKMVDGAAAEAKHSGIRIEYLASAEQLDADWLVRRAANPREGGKNFGSTGRDLSEWPE